MEENEKDIFDVIMSRKLFNPLYPFYRKYKEGLLYLLFGGLTFFLAIGIYTILSQFFLIDALVSNIVSWIAGVYFSFFTTRKWVFKSETEGIKAMLAQMGEFGAARLATLILQEILLYIFIMRLRYNSLFIKICTEIINIIINYLVSKFKIFRK